MLRGWHRAATLVKRVLVREHGHTMAGLVQDCTAGGWTLLHLAVASRSAGMVEARAGWGGGQEGGGVALNWAHPGADGRTPLHLAAAAADGGATARAVLDSHADACAAWFAACLPGLPSATPARFAARSGYGWLNRVALQKLTMRGGKVLQPGPHGAAQLLAAQLLLPQLGGGAVPGAAGQPLAGVADANAEGAAAQQLLAVLVASVMRGAAGGQAAGSQADALGVAHAAATSLCLAADEAENSLAVLPLADPAGPGQVSLQAAKDLGGASSPTNPLSAVLSSATTGMSTMGANSLALQSLLLVAHGSPGGSGMHLVVGEGDPATGEDLSHEGRGLMLSLLSLSQHAGAKGQDALESAGASVLAALRGAARGGSQGGAGPSPRLLAGGSLGPAALSTGAPAGPEPAAQPAAGQPPQVLLEGPLPGGEEVEEGLASLLQEAGQRAAGQAVAQQGPAEPAPPPQACGAPMGAVLALLVAVLALLLAWLLSRMA